MHDRTHAAAAIVHASSTESDSETASSVAKTPKWANYHAKMAGEFPSPFRGDDDPLARQINKFVEKLDMLRPEKGGPAFLGKSPALTYAYPDVKNITVPQAMGDLDQVLDDVVGLFEGAPNWGNPLTMCNVIPQSNTAAVVASMLSQVFSANILEGNMPGTSIVPSWRRRAWSRTCLAGLRSTAARSTLMAAVAAGPTA
ncbi:hypothetical protein [Sphingomonas paeninsulae]|uniref:hypothetical protein n=1 Tax=Sphingomonas paeninsulae TaxID=2319844 RepID=UPI001EF08C1D|nr:hypothetical protein [Sphingomonas paeninsulae]